MFVAKRNGDHNRVANSPLKGAEFVFMPDSAPYETPENPEYNVVVAPGMKVEIVSVWKDWKGVAGLDMLYVFVPDTGMHTHLVPADLGLTL